MSENNDSKPRSKGLEEHIKELKEQDIPSNWSDIKYYLDNNEGLLPVCDPPSIRSICQYKENNTYTCSRLLSMNQCPRDYHKHLDLTGMSGCNHNHQTQVGKIPNGLTVVVCNDCGAYTEVNIKEPRLEESKWYPINFTKELIRDLTKLLDFCFKNHPFSPKSLRDLHGELMDVLLNGCWRHGVMTIPFKENPSCTVWICPKCSPEQYAMAEKGDFSFRD